MTDAGSRPGSGARTWLFVPGDRPDRFDKAVASGADEVICDLEDAVGPDAKVEARGGVAAWLAGGGSGWVRINGIGTPWHGGDLAALRGLAGLRGVIVPKAESADSLTAIGRLLGPAVGIVALIESAIGVVNALEVASCPAVDRLAFGSIDFAYDIGAAEQDDVLLPARSALVLASRVAGLPAPVDGVTVTIADPAVVVADAQRARSLGFGGKLCIHPGQVEPVATAMRPTAEQVTWARQVLRAAGESGGAATAMSGQMIDKPVLDRARRILAETAAV